jgi:hypothetical protein
LDLVIFRLFDNVVHTWDLARALGVEEQINEMLVSVTYDKILPHHAGVAQATESLGERPDGGVVDGVEVHRAAPGNRVVALSYGAPGMSRYVA